jgi:FkbM family methyltransferase
VQSETPFSFSWQSRKHRLYLHPPGEYLSDRIRERRTWYEDELLAATLNLLPASPQWIVDVGANLGNHALFWASYLPQAVVWAFEPHPDNFPLLALNTQAYKNVFLFNQALGKERTEVHLTVNKTNMGKVGSAVHNTGEAPYTVPVMRLDELATAQAPPLPLTLMKLDVEGMEEDVLRGAAALIAQHKPILLIEANTLKHLGQLLDCVTPWGYVLTARHNAYANAPTFEFRYRPT